MLEFGIRKNMWEPNVSGINQIAEIFDKVDGLKKNESDTGECFVILKAVPYIEAAYVTFDMIDGVKSNICYILFSFHEGYAWEREKENIFERQVLMNPSCRITAEYLDLIFEFYSNEHPEWHLKRYYTTPIRLFDHIYHCIKKNTAKEMLYKAGLDNLAAYFSTIDSENLLATKPSDLYDGLTIKSLRALNCKGGSTLLSEARCREMVLKLQGSFPAIFEDSLNDAQALYIKRLIDGDLTLSEIGRLYMAARQRLSTVWIKPQYDLFINEKNIEKKAYEIVERLIKIDPIYKDLIKNNDRLKSAWDNGTIQYLEKYLLLEKDKYDAAIRRSNRKRSVEWEEHFAGYVFRYPQTANDFCREAVYMRNCLLEYMEAFIENETTIIFMRDEWDVNMPFITIEVYNYGLQDETLEQAYHRFNKDCTSEEADIIREYCNRHMIDDSMFCFDWERDHDF